MFKFEIIVHTITIHTVATIGPIEFSANTESNSASASYNSEWRQPDKQRLQRNATLYHL